MAAPSGKKDVKKETGLALKFKKVSCSCVICSAFNACIQCISPSTFTYFKSIIDRKF